MQNTNKTFAFLVLIYNHEKYILEHLESIKFLIQEHGDRIFFDLIVNDDCSKDLSRQLVDKWLHINGNLFRNIDKIYNSTNLGTCKSVSNMLSTMRSDVDVCKITAGDDIYSFVNMFDYAFKYSDAPILSGIPLHFSEKELYLDSKEFLGAVASHFCYKKSHLSKRFKFLSVNNAPNIIYNKQLLTSKYVLDFLSSYDVVEDWPIQIAISEIAEKSNFELIDQVFVYYRRTAGSIFIVANDRFKKDKLKIYSYLIDNSTTFLEKVVLINRRWLFDIQNSLLNKFFNIAFYIFSLKSFFNLRNIYFFKKKFCPDLYKHDLHLKLIRKNAENLNLTKDDIK